MESSKINKIFQRDFNSISDLLIAIYPDITERDIKLVKSECKSMISNIIHEIGNSINAKTHEITLE